MAHVWKRGGGFKYFLFNPYSWKMIQFDLRIFFKLGWFNHHIWKETPFCIPSSWLDPSWNNRWRGQTSGQSACFRETHSTRGAPTGGAPWDVWRNDFSVVVSNIFHVHPYCHLGKMDPIWWAYCSDGLKPPPRFPFLVFKPPMEDDLLHHMSFSWRLLVQMNTWNNIRPL